MVTYFHVGFGFSSAIFPISYDPTPGLLTESMFESRDEPENRWISGFGLFAEVNAERSNINLMKHFICF